MLDKVFETRISEREGTERVRRFAEVEDARSYAKQLTYGKAFECAGTVAAVVGISQVDGSELMQVLYRATWNPKDPTLHEWENTSAIRGIKTALRKIEHRGDVAEFSAWHEALTGVLDRVQA